MKIMSLEHRTRLGARPTKVKLVLAFSFSILPISFFPAAARSRNSTHDKCRFRAVAACIFSFEPSINGGAHTSRNRPTPVATHGVYFDRRFSKIYTISRGH